MQKNWKNRRKLPYFLLVLMLLILPVCLDAEAAEPGDHITSRTQDQPSDAENDPVMIRVEGALEELDRSAILVRLNEIRAEACREGVPNPVNGEPLSKEDYVPLEWSEELGKIAILRAAESTILQDHIRPDGTECFSAAPEGVPFTMETLAWGYGSAAAAVEGWYSEKAAYVEVTGTPAGHYMALINPENRFVGIADLRAKWQRDACAGAFASHGMADQENVADQANADDQAAGPDQADVAGQAAGPVPAQEINVWNIPLLRSYLPSVIDKAVRITALRILSAAQFMR